MRILTLKQTLLTMLLGVALCAAGCAMHSYEAVPSAAVDLSGRWMLDTAASDDALKLIGEAAPPPPSRPPAGRDATAFGAPSAADDGSTGRRGGRGGRGSAQGQSSQDRPSIDDTGPRLRPSERAQFVRYTVVPVELMEIEQAAGRFVLVQGERRRTFEPGLAAPLSVTDHYGSREIRAGWSGREFVIAGEDRNHVSVQEHLRAGPGTDTLELEITLKAWNYKKIHVRALYRRTDASMPLPAAADGPPARGAH